MSVSIAIKVSDGLVLASDSSTTIAVTDDEGNTGIAKVYENANKIAQINSCPVGVLTWGVGSLQSKTITRLVEEFGENHAADSGFNKELLNDFIDFFRRLYLDEFGEEGEQRPGLGLAIGGVIGSGEPTLHMVEFPEPAEINNLRAEGNFGANWFGQVDAISRLHKGYDPKLPTLLRQNTDMSDEEIKDTLSQLEQTVYWGGMPLQDAVSIADYLISTSKDYYKYGSGAPTCGGPTDIAVISHGEFKWVEQKQLEVR